MHMQTGLEDYDVFVRSLGIGPQISSFRYDPAQPMHGRYMIDHNFLNAEKGREARIITKVINAFFRWDFNSCEAILKDGTLWPIDFANACPDIAVTSLHYYFRLYARKCTRQEGHAVLGQVSGSCRSYESQRRER